MELDGGNCSDSRSGRCTQGKGTPNPIGLDWVNPRAGLDSLAERKCH